MTQDSPFTQFIERLKTDEALRQKVSEAEHQAARDSARLKAQLDDAGDANLAALKRIASDAGFDITVDIRRPDEVQLPPSEQELDNLGCWLTCCWVETSVLIAEEQSPRA